MKGLSSQNTVETREIMIPFRTFNGYLKRIDVNRLSSKQKSLFSLAFSEFFSEEDYNVKAINQDRYKSTVKIWESDGNTRIVGNETPFKYRRFSGGAYLPRGRYYSVCKDGSGNDSQALAGELLAYYIPEKAGEIALLDLDGSDATAQAGRVFFEQRCGLRNSKNMIAMQCHSRFGIPSPILSEFTSPSFIPGTLDCAVFLETEVVESRISNVIDLRFPDVQKWMYESLHSGIPRTLYLYDNEPSVSAFYPHIIPDDLFDSPLFKAGPGTAGIINPPNDDWDGKKIYYSDKRSDLLSFLMYPSAMGGTPITNGIGRWLQSIGANALVYPSARSDIMCSVKGDQISDFAGFLLVDYRNSPEIPDEFRVICEPYSWKENWGSMQSDTQIEWSSSWAVTGIARTLVQIKMQQVIEYYKSRGVSEQRISSWLSEEGDEAPQSESPAGIPEKTVERKVMSGGLLQSLASRIRLPKRSKNRSG